MDREREDMQEEGKKEMNEHASLRDKMK